MCRSMYNLWSLFKYSIVLEGVPAPNLSPFLKYLFLLLSFLFYPVLRYFRQSPPTLTISSCTNSTHQLSSHIMGLKKYQKSDCNSSNIASYQKSIFDFLNAFLYRYIRFNLWDIFRFIFRQLRMTFFIKLWFIFKCIT